MTGRLLAVLLLLVAATPAAAQMSDSDVVMRLDALEGQIRELTGQVEQLQHRNQQLEQQLRRTIEDNEYRFQELGGKPPRAAQPMPQRAPQPQTQQQAQPPMPMPQQPQTPAAPGRRGDAFDPNANPVAPGAPRPLGSLPPGQPSAQRIEPDDSGAVGARGGREPGSPLDLSTMANNAANDPALERRGGSLPAPPQRNPGGTGLAAVAPPGESPREQFDFGYGHILRKDYAAAEQTFRDFLQRFPSDRLTPDANYWLGESLFQRQRYQDAAEIYLVVTTKFESAAKAPDALLRLGQSLAQIGQREMACASFAEVGRKYPRASAQVKQGVEREQKRVRC
jgi:tol-pal system protein YbgF